MESGKPVRAVVVGGGISGLSAAWYLRRAANDARIPVETSLLEASNRVGGVLRSERRDGFLLEHGPDCFISSKPEGIELACELGLESELIGTNPKCRRSFIVSNGRLVPVPQGFYLLSPVSLSALIKAPMFTPWGKLRMAMELFMPPRTDVGDESLASFVRRRFGEEALERFAQPMVGGIYTADPERLSLAATFPAFLDMEREHGSVIRGLGRKARNGAESSASGPRYGLFVSLSGGMERLPQALAERLGPGVVRAGTRVQSLSRDGLTRCWNLTLASGERVRADVVILALPAWASAKLMEGVDAELARRLATIPYASSVTVNLAFEREAFAAGLPDGMGLVVPEREKRDLLACSFSTNKFDGRSPDGKILLRAFMGGALRPDVAELDDGDVERRALSDVRDLLNFQGEPVFARVAKHRATMAQYEVGHLEKVARIQAGAAAHEGLALIGNGFKGIGIPDCIREARAAAMEMIGAVKSNTMIGVNL
ncbi:MAG: protoporphyrinogen oxidase [Planctomycetaceae bacterium]|nr:protoporphyrinogen oxidase [Planctomycetaceae bacterium]